MPQRLLQDAGVRVLLIEDEPAHAALIEQNLGVIRHPRIELHHAVNLSTGLGLILEQSCDVILLDVNLPESRGIETVERVIEACPDLPVIVLTAMDDEEIAAQALRHGVEDYLVKSQLSPDLLARSIRYAIERKRHRRELQRYASKLERINRELEEFAHVVSHELKTPLWVINYALDLIVREAGSLLNDDTRKMVANAQDAVQQASTVIKSLLSYARVTQPDSRMDIIDTGEAMDEAVAALRVIIDNSGARVEHDAMPRVLANKSQLVHVFRNLIENAVKYRGPEPPRIRVSAHMHNGQCQIAVSDNGVGIDPQFAPRAFNMFERGATNTGGTGIGLAICKRIIERHGGRIWIEGDRDCGAAVCFTLIPAESFAEQPEPAGEAVA
jgi:signal transduction histidine kinase